MFLLLINYASTLPVSIANHSIAGQAMRERIVYRYPCRATHNCEETANKQPFVSSIKNKLRHSYTYVYYLFLTYLYTIYLSLTSIRPVIQKDGEKYLLPVMEQ